MIIADGVKMTFIDAGHVLGSAQILMLSGVGPAEHLKTKGIAVAQAARRVSSFTEGSPEQRQAWEIEIDKLWKGGFIDEEYRDLWKKNGPNPEIINEALDIGKWAESYTGKNAVNRARAEQIQTRAENDTRLTDARVGDIGIVGAGFGDDLDPDRPLALGPFGQQAAAVDLHLAPHLVHLVEAEPALASVSLDFPAGKSRLGHQTAAEGVLVDLEDQLGHLPRRKAAQHLLVPGREGLLPDPALHLQRAVAKLLEILVSEHCCSQR